MTSQWAPQPPEFDQSSWSNGPYAAGGGYTGSSAPWPTAAQPRPWERPDYGVRRDLPLALMMVGSLAIAGVVAGFLWHAVSARPAFGQGAGGSISFPAGVDKNYFGAEAAFFAVTATAGLLAGIATWRAGRRRGPAVAVALAGGSVLAGLLTRAVGEAQVTDASLAKICGTDDSLAGLCAIYDGHLRLRVIGLVFAWALTALASFLALSAVFDRPRKSTAAWTPMQTWPPPLPAPAQSWPPPPG